MKEDIVGKVFTTNKNGGCVVTKYVGCNEVHIKFLNTEFERITDLNSLRNGFVKDTSLSKTYKKYNLCSRNIVGEEFENNSGKKYEVVEQLGASKFRIKFIDSGYETEVKKGNIERGAIKDRTNLNDHKELVGKCFYDEKLKLYFTVIKLTHFNGERKFIVESLDEHIRLVLDYGTVLEGKVSEVLKVSPIYTDQTLPFHKVNGEVLFAGEKFKELNSYLANIFFYMSEGKLYHRYISRKALPIDFKTKLNNQKHDAEVNDNDNYVSIMNTRFYKSDVIKLLNNSIHTIDCISKQESLIVNLNLEQEYTIWMSMVSRCKAGYAKLSKDFEIFWDWLDWAKRQKGFLCKDVSGKVFQMESDMFSDEKMYSPDTIVFVPNSLNQMCKPTKKGKLPKGIQYFIDREKPYRAYSPYKGLQKHLGYFETLEEALETVKNSRKEYLLNLKSLYSDCVEDKVFIELMKDRWIM